jgi:hypothetical protein
VTAQAWRCHSGLRRRAFDEPDTRVRVRLEGAALAPSNAPVPEHKVLGYDGSVEEGIWNGHR